MADNHYDVIIIGTGAGGGTLAYRLAPSGKRILLLERGGYVPREKQNWDSRAVEVENRYHIKEPWYDRDGKEFHAGTHYFVGGNTKFYGAALIRLRKQDFGQVAHQGGVSPAWPIAYDDLEPYYTEAEHLYQVHGLRGSDPTEPPASAPYLHPPLSHEPRIQQLVDDLTRIGHRPFHMPVGVMLDEQNPRQSRCIRCDTCDGFPCLVYAKADAQVSCVDPALTHPNVTLLTDAYVPRLDRIAPGWTLEKMAEHTLSFWLTSEDLPHPDNRVTVDRDGRITLSYTPNNEEGHRRLVAKLKGMLKEIRCHDHLIPLNAYIPARIPLAGVAHQNGTVRFGPDPKTSALDVHCKAHEVDNLYVVDASFFPSNCAVNPALTIMANAFRVGDHLRERLA